MFMDYHKDLSVSVEAVKKAHIADESVQKKYGVTYHQFWVNEDEGTVFCLIEAPDKESCEAVHREAHGNIACSIVEVSEGFYTLFMGKGHMVEDGWVKAQDGRPDLGIRYVLVIHVHGLTSLTASEYRALKTPFRAKDLVVSLLSRFHGREVNRFHDDSLMAVFDSPSNAVECALEIQKQLLHKKTVVPNDEWNITFKMGLSAGQPVTESGDFFSEAITLARRLCSVANVNEVLMSSRLQEQGDVTHMARDLKLVRLLNPREQHFINNLFSISEENLSDEHFTVESLSRNIGMSRPQLYRKIVALTGKSPNDFIRDLRMERALSLIRQKAGNISEIALEVGYNNPSYFARCFQMRYGCTPSRVNTTI